jgi:hypothetical protein
VAWHIFPGRLTFSETSGVVDMKYKINRTRYHFVCGQLESFDQFTPKRSIDLVRTVLNHLLDSLELEDGKQGTAADTCYDYACLLFEEDTFNDFTLERIRFCRLFDTFRPGGTAELQFCQHVVFGER